jgi:purine-binding chemotaxis protein CheW
MLGVINLRGSIVPIIDLGGRLGRDASRTDDASARILVLEEGDTTIGAVVSSVDEVRTVDPEQVQEAPAGAASTFIDAVVTVDERLIMLLDASTLLGGAQAQAATEAHAA